MCTAISYKTKDHYFGRSLDYDIEYPCEVVVTPKGFALPLRSGEIINDHYAMIGMAYAGSEFPLYFDAANEKGLAIAALSFPYNAVYRTPKEGIDNIAQFELIPWLLSCARSLQEAIGLLRKINVTDQSYSADLPASPLHWLIADRDSSVVLEATSSGIEIHENPVGVLTNNPPFAIQCFNLNNYLSLSARDPLNGFSQRLGLSLYSRGMGGLGLPGDLSSQSRFVRASFIKENSLCAGGENESVSQFFHILDSVKQPLGCCMVGNDRYEYTIYTSCCNTDRGIYYYTTYNNRQITAIDMFKCDLEQERLLRFPLIKAEQIRHQL